MDIWVIKYAYINEKVNYFMKKISVRKLKFTQLDDKRIYEAFKRAEAAAKENERYFGRYTLLGFAFIIIVIGGGWLGDKLFHILNYSWVSDIWMLMVIGAMVIWAIPFALFCCYWPQKLRVRKYKKAAEKGQIWYAEVRCILFRKKDLHVRPRYSSRPTYAGTKYYAKVKTRDGKLVKKKFIVGSRRGANLQGRWVYVVKIGRGSHSYCVLPDVSVGFGERYVEDMIASFWGEPR